MHGGEEENEEDKKKRSSRHHKTSPSSKDEAKSPKKKDEKDDDRTLKKKASTAKVHSKSNSSSSDLRVDKSDNTPKIEKISSNHEETHKIEKGKEGEASPESFEKLKLIGKGDVGKVYLVRHKQSQQLYAMKILTKSEMMRRNKVKRVLTEREILATADHPFIVTLYWSFQSQDSLFFIMEYCAGGEFFRTLQKQPGKRLPEDCAKFYAAEVLLALEYLHMSGFIYRDLKPENILLHETGHIMLTDFDLSKASNAPVHPRIVKGLFEGEHSAKVDLVPDVVTNSFVGTEEYIAPEVIEGFGHTSSVDWWTYGVLIYEMLYGKTPFKGQSRDQTFAQICKAGVKFPDTPSISREGRSLIKKLLCADPRKRLGHHHGAADIKAHPWFGPVKWALLRNMKPPFEPHLEHELDTSNFRAIKDDNAPDLGEEVDVKDLPPSDPWKNFDRGGKGENTIKRAKSERELHSKSHSEKEPHEKDLNHKGGKHKDKKEEEHSEEHKVFTVESREQIAILTRY